jgi:signal transduction histidine kinase
VAYYTNLRPGAYQFRVIAANHHNVWNQTGATFAFSLAPFYYQTWWFWTACGAAVALAVFGVHRWRVSYVRTIHELRAQAAVADERTRIARDLHDHLGASLTHLRLLAELAERQPPEALTNYLRDLSQTAREAALHLREFIWATQPVDETLDGLVTRICQHAESFLRPAGIRCQFHLPEQVPSAPLSPLVRHNLFMAAREALHNAGRHSGASEVSIRLELNGARFALHIEDDGRGVASTAAQHAPLTGGRGAGLGNMRARIEQLGGRFDIQNRPSGGTCIVFDLPLPKSSHDHPKS